MEANDNREMVPMEEYQSMRRQMLDKQASMEERLWVDSRLTQFDDVLRDNYDKSLEDFSSAIITHLSESTEALKGGFFNVDHENQRIYASAGYACTVNSMEQTNFGFGEGFVGQAVLSQRFLYIKDIPNENLYTQSPLGNLSAGTMFIVPLIFNKKVYGVIELLYLKELESKFLDLIKRLSINIASMLQSIQSNSQTKALFQQSLKQAEELRAQEEEMRQNLEELSATQEEMKRKELEMSGQLAAINNSSATIVFNMDGTIIEANGIFLDAMKYDLEEVKGKHHSIFVDYKYGQSDSYKRFWDSLRKGIPQTGEFKRFDKNGDTIWISASYTPVIGTDGKPYKVIKIAMDVTEQKLQSLDFNSQLDAIDKSNAVIEFELDSTIVRANDNFLAVTGYTASEIVGQKHMMFVDERTRNSEQYKLFWDSLRAGTHAEGEFKRYNKEGKEVWIRASYNPILDTEGKPYKVIKFAIDITEQKLLEKQAMQQTEELKAQEEEMRQNLEELSATQDQMRLNEMEISGQLNAINNSCASITFNTDGIIIEANEIFLGAVKYDLNEVQGKHHRIFVDKTYGDSVEYKRFWENLKNGQAQTGEFKRFDKNGNAVWISASYTPVFSGSGEVVKIIKIAFDITEQKMLALDFNNQLNAINRSNAVIEFELDSTIIKANDNFLAVTGYDSDQVIGNKHNMFVTKEMAKSDEYKEFWNKLRKGQFFEGEFMRINKAGEEIWIRASYNPIRDENGKPYKVIKFAVDITAQKKK